MHDEIASHDAKQRGDKGKCRQFAGGNLPPTGRCLCHSLLVKILTNNGIFGPY
jgi:hypothetical protein